MATLVVPPLDEEPWPTLGPEVCSFIEDVAVYGPGDLAGQDYRITDEFRAQLYRAYEVFPKGHPQEGRRRFKKVSLEERKGTAKTERAAVVTLAEAFPDAPVRFDGWRKVGKLYEPVGRPVRSPYIPMVAYTLEQGEDLGYAVLRFIIENAQDDLSRIFDVGLERILVLDERGREAGKVAALAGSPNARDGARTTFAHFDEPHRMFSTVLKKAWSTMGENIYKRVEADAWTLTTSTAGEPGEGSVEEDIWREAEAVAAGKAKSPRSFFFRRYCPNDRPMNTRDEVLAALVEASGPNASWSGDLEGLVDRYFEPSTDRSYFARVWLNQWRPGSGTAFDVETFRANAVPGRKVAASELVVLGFDGSQSRDCTALVATAVYRPHQWCLGVWERPAAAGDDWEIPVDEVDEVVDEAFKRWPVWRLYADPYKWREPIDRWTGRYGDDRIFRWNTTRRRPMAHACRNYQEAIATGAFTNDGHAEFTTHIGNAKRAKIQTMQFDDGQPCWVLTKESQHEFIDAAVAGVLSWEARNDAIAAGAQPPKAKDRKLRTW